jgi:hypothetical protein
VIFGSGEWFECVLGFMVKGWCCFGLHGIYGSAKVDWQL